MLIRLPKYADRFYPGSRSGCESLIRELMPDVRRDLKHLRPIGGIVPHAGWAYSGHVAAQVFASSVTDDPVTRIVFLGAIHSVRARQGIVYPGGKWQTPLGEIEIDSEFNRRLLSSSEFFAVGAGEHDQEHSIEVQVPLAQHFFPGARMVAIMIPAVPEAVTMGEKIGECLAGEQGMRIVGTTDLTHYGPNYHQTGHGTGSKGIEWASNVNDQRMLSLIIKGNTDRILSEAAEHGNACGPGAVIATLSACKHLGADHCVLLDHDTSAAVVRRRHGMQPDDSVGYAGIYIGRSIAAEPS